MLFPWHFIESGWLLTGNYLSDRAAPEIEPLELRLRFVARPDEMVAELIAHLGPLE